MKKTLYLLSLFAIANSLQASVPLKWTVETSRVQPAQFDAYHGETLDLEATFLSYGSPLALPADADCRIFWQTNGMGNVYWSTNAVLVSSNAIAAVFLPTFDPGATTVLGFLGIPASNYRAAFTIRFRGSPGATPFNPPPMPQAEYYTKPEVDSRIGSATNAIRRVDGAVRPLPPYLHALDFDDAYPEDAAWYYAQPQDYGQCSSVRDGNSFARNYDWKFDRAAEFVVRMSAGPGRFASVGVANCGTNLTEEIATGGKWSRYFKCLPGRTVDGINENGVAVNVNVVSGAPAWQTGDGLHPLAAVRWVLDNATSAASAAQHLAESIRFPVGWTQNFHWMIADAEETWIVENGAAHKVTGRAAMTNFPLYPTRGSGEGQERYDALMGGSNITSQWWTLTYTPGGYRASDLPGIDSNLVFAAWASKPRESHRGETFGDVAWWQTVHTSVYDITNLTLRVAVQERDDWYVFAVQSLEPATNYTDAKFDELSSSIAEATNHLDLSIQDKFSQHKPTAVISENPDYYRQGRAGEMGYGYAWEVLSGDGRQRFAAYAPKVSPRITLSSIDGDYDPLINHYGSLYTVSNTISEVTAIAEEDATIQAYYHQVDVSYSSTNDIPIIYHVHRNILSGVAELTDVSVSGGTYFEFEDDGVWHNVYGIYSSGTNITYTDEYYDGSTWQYAERQIVVSLDDTTPAEYERIIFGGVNIVTDITKGDSISVLTERTGKPGDCGTGWGYKVFEFATDVRSWRVNVPNLTCSAVSTNTTQIRDSTYLSHYADPFYANPNALRSLTEPVRTEGKYSSDGCSNVDYKVTFYPDTLGHNPTNELVFIASGVSITNGIVSLRPVEDSRWTLTHSGNEHHGWVYHPSFVVRSTRGNQHTYNVNITDIPCEADGTIYPTKVGSLFEIKFHHTSGTDVFRFSVGGLISKTFAAYKLVNTEDQHLYYDEGLKCTWELAVTNGCFFGTRVSNDDYRRAD